MSKEAALILGALAALINGIVTVAGLGSFDDGFQWEDLIPILAPVAAALGIREAVFSKAFIERFAPEAITRADQERDRKRGEPEAYRRGDRS